jgi:hypothetical protein
VVRKPVEEMAITTRANMLVTIDPPLRHYLPPLPYPIYGHDREHIYA